MDEQIFLTGSLMKAARKFKNLNQVDVANAIGCSQSALSKMEHDLLTPSAPQWFLFARFTSIPPTTLETGVIDRHLRVKFNSEDVSLGFKVPKKYRYLRAEKIREVYPFLSYLEKNISPPLDKDFTNLIGLDSEFYIDFDNLVNFQLMIDVIEYFINQGISSSEHIRKIVYFGQNDVYWDRYSIEWKEINTVSGLLQEFTREQGFFQADFDLKVETNAGRTTLSYFPEYHLKPMAQNISSQVISFLNHYRKETLQNLISRFLNLEVAVELLPDVGSSALAARFEIKAS